MSPLEKLLASDRQARIAQARLAAGRALARLEKRGVRAKLVGSLARGDFFPRSDIDLLVLSCSPELRDSLESEVEQERSAWPFDVIYLEDVAPARRAKLLAEAVDASALR